MIKFAKDIRKPKRIFLPVWLLVMLLVPAFLVIKPEPVKAAESFITVKEINYEDSTITLQLNQSDTTVYMSDSLKKNWEIIPGSIGSDNTLVMDISWIPVSKNYIITLKGNYSVGITTVVIPKQATTFKASYNILKGSVSFSNAGARTVEWRKKDSARWNTVNMDTISSELSYFIQNGASVYFRLAPINGSSSTDVGCRASKEVSVSVPKKTAAPVVSVNGSRFIISIKKGMAYRTVNDNGSITSWKDVLRTEDFSLTDIAPAAMYSAGQAAGSEVTLQFRTNATSTKQVSNLTEITVPVQEGPPDTGKYGISFSYDSSSSLLLQIKSASEEMPFEYTIVKPGSELKFLTAAWNTVTSSDGISISKRTAPAGSRIYLRKKYIAASEDTDFALASASIEITPAGGVAYPDAPKAETLKNLVAVAGVCRTGNSSGYLSFALNSPVKTTVSSIDFSDKYGSKKGSVSVQSTVASNPNSTGIMDKYIITTRITSTSSLDTVTNEVLYAKITLASKDVIISSDTAGVRLYLYPATSVNNTNTEYTSDFQRIYLSNADGDKQGFKFQLDFGTAKVIDPSGIEKYTQEATEIKSIRYGGYQLIKDTEYTVEYSSYADEDGKQIPTAVVSINAAAFEKSLTQPKMNEKIPLFIELNNNEVLNDDVSITLIPTAQIKNIPISWSITEGSLQETKASTITNEDGSKTTTSEEVITYKIELTLFDPDYSIGVSDVTWGERSIMGSAEVSAGNVVILLSNAKINKLTTDSTDTKNVVITFSNGFTIKTGIKLTIINAAG